MIDLLGCAGQTIHLIEILLGLGKLKQIKIVKINNLIIKND